MTKQASAETTMNTRSALVFLLALVAVASATAVRGADEPQLVTLTTGDAAKLSARYFPGNQGGKSPAVIVLDDLADDARPAVCDDIARQLAKEGCTALCFDFRGCGRSQTVEPEFWDSATNQQLVKGYKADGPPEAIRFADFKPGYLPALANDIAAARAYLERRNDARECNTGQMYLIGFGRGAALGQLWLASEWSRYRVSGFQSKLAANPDGRDVAGCVWIGPRFALDRPVPMFDLLKKSEARKSTLVGLIHDSDDAEGARFARQCQDAFNVKGKAPLVATHAVPHDTKSLGRRGEVAEQIGKFIAGMRKLQELPPWDDRDFVDRRYVWAFRGAPPMPAKDEGDYHFQPVPVEQLLGKR
jgi:dienelactone hydrolase